MSRRGQLRPPGLAVGVVFALLILWTAPASSEGDRIVV